MSAGVIIVVVVISFTILAIVYLLTKNQAGNATTQQLGPYSNLVLLSEKGGMAKIYRAFNTETGRDVALKVLRTEHIGESEVTKKFIRESEILKKVKSTDINASVPEVYNSGTIKTGVIELPFIEMEYIDGIDLSEHLKRKGTLNPEDAEKIVSVIAGTLNSAHISGVIHRDLKPGNIILRSDSAFEVVVLDFGVGKMMDSKSVTIGGYGTAAYMSPEQCSGSVLTPKSDVYSLGLLWYELITGKKLVDNDNPLLAMDTHKSGIDTRKLTGMPLIMINCLKNEPSARIDMTDISSEFQVDFSKLQGKKRSIKPKAAHTLGAKPIGSRKAVFALGGILIPLLGILFYQLIAPSTESFSFDKSKRFIVPENVTKMFLNLDSDPKNADVFFSDGSFIGTTPIKDMMFPTGANYVIVRKDFYKPYKLTFVLSQNQSENEPLLVNLENETGFLIVQTEPGGVEIFDQNDKPLGQSNSKIEMSAGVNKVFLKLVNYNTKELTVTIPQKEILEYASKIIMSKGNGYLTVQSNQKSITITGNGFNLPVPLNRHTLKSGVYNLTFSREGFLPQTKKVSINLGEESSLNINLDPEFGFLTVNTKPGNVNVYLNNEQNLFGTSDISKRKIPIGRYKLLFRKSKYNSASRDIEISKEKHVTLSDIELVPRFGIIDIKTSPPGAKIEISNLEDMIIKEYGTTPKKVTGLFEGRYFMRLVPAAANEYEDIRKNIIVTYNKTTSITHNFSRGNGYLTVMIVPAGKVYINGQFKKETPLSKSPLKTGYYDLEIRRSGRNTYKERVFIELGKENKIIAKWK